MLAAVCMATSRRHTSEQPCGAVFFTCIPISMCRGVLQELDSVVNRARMFQYKPDGEVTFRMAQDAVGLPAPLMQDPIHYPHGTKFMAPGASPHSLRILPSIEASVGAVCSVSANALQSDVPHGQHSISSISVAVRSTRAAGV